MSGAVWCSVFAGGHSIPACHAACLRASKVKMGALQSIALNSKLLLPEQKVSPFLACFVSSETARL